MQTCNAAIGIIHQYIAQIFKRVPGVFRHKRKKEGQVQHGDQLYLVIFPGHPHRGIPAASASKAYKNEKSILQIPGFDKMGYVLVERFGGKIVATEGEKMVTFSQDPGTCLSMRSISAGP